MHTNKRAAQTHTQPTKQDNALDLEQLCEALLLLKTPDEMLRFLKDLCTPNELNDMADRWKTCKILAKNELSYREINAQTGISLVTIGRVARFLNTEPHQGYKLALDRLEKNYKKRKDIP